MNSKLSQLPFLRLIIPLILGITLALYFPAGSLLLYLFSIISFCLLLLWNWHSNKNQNYSQRWIFGAITALSLVVAGYTITVIRSPQQSQSYYEHYLKENRDSLTVTIASQPQEKEKTIKATGEIISVMVNGKWQTTSGKGLFYFEKDSLTGNIKYGDVLTIYTALQKIKPASNPDEFDYSNYLALHDIYSEAYLKNGAYSFTGKNNANWLVSLTNKYRSKLISLLDERIKGTEANVASAILLGYRDDLSPAIIQQFADSGTIHVICVAGLHVGILFWLFGLLLLPLEKLKHGKLIRTVFLVLLLWFYALFTGLATPVIRATVMFSFLSIGRHFGRYTNSINTLAASAFLILLLNPFSLADTGFQLSYLAVLGILVIYPMLNQLLEPRKFLLEKIWELACLSIAAQVAIIPLSILYFHQFPNYFILTNLLIVPLLSIVIYAGILFFITANIPFVSGITTWILQKSLWLMNSLVSKASYLPYFVTKGISISIPEALLLYIALIAMLVFALRKKYRSLFVALGCFTIFLGVRVYKDFIHSRQQLFVVYDIPQHSAIAFISGKQCLTTYTIDSLSFCYHIQNHWWERGIKDSSSTYHNGSFLANHLVVKDDHAQFNNLQIAFINENTVLSSSQKVKVKYLVLSGGYRLDMATLQNAFIFDRLIFDSSVFTYRLKKWKEECEQRHISYYDVNTQGAFVETI